MMKGANFLLKTMEANPDLVNQLYDGSKKVGKKVFSKKGLYKF